MRCSLVTWASVSIGGGWLVIPRWGDLHSTSNRQGTALVMVAERGAGALRRYHQRTIRQAGVPSRLARAFLASSGCSVDRRVAMREASVIFLPSAGWLRSAPDLARPQGAA